MSGMDERSAPAEPGQASAASWVRLREAIEPIVADAGFDLEAVTVSAAGRRRVVKIIVDSDDGVDLDRAAELSRAVSVLLDADDAVLGPAPYVLEVTSPGVGRPLTLPRHFRRSRRRLLVVSTTDGGSVTGHLLRVVEPDAEPGTADEATPAPGITLLVGPKADEVILAWDQVARAKVEVEFSPPPAAVRERLEAELGPIAAVEPVDLTDGHDLDGGDLDEDDSDDEHDDEREKEGAPR